MFLADGCNPRSVSMQIFAHSMEGTQRPLLGAAKLAHSLELAGVRQRKLERGNPNSPYGVTGADALIVGYLLAVERQLQDWMSCSSAVRQQIKALHSD